jgi:succinoglycan biosynthesis transport protein ExoP
MGQEDEAAPSITMLVRQRWPILVGVALAVALPGLLYTKGLPNKYQADAVLAFQPKPNTGLAGDVVTLTLPRYVVVAQSDSTTAAAANSLGLDKSAVQRSLQVSVPTQTANVKVTVTSDSAATAAGIANAVAQQTQSVASSDRILDVALVQRAIAPTGPIGPKRKLYDVAALVAGLLLGLLAAAAVAALDPRVATTREAAEAAGLPILGNIRLGRRLRRLSGRQLAASETAIDAVAHAGTALRRALRNRSAPADAVVLVSSVDRHVDRSRVSLLLAASLNRLHLRVLLVDADARAGTLTELLGVSPSGGDEPIELSVLKMDFLPSRSRIGDLYDVLAASRADLDDLCGRYDVIVVDAPPVDYEPMTDSFAALGPTTVLVVRRKNRRPAVSAAAASLRAADPHVVGIVGADLIATGRSSVGPGYFENSASAPAR